MKSDLIKLIPTLRRFANALSGNHADADDLVQATVERLLAKQLPPGVNITQWAFRVMKNLWIDDYRARQVRLRAQSEHDSWHQQSHDGENELTMAMELQATNQAMSTLPDEQRLVLALIAVQGLSYKETASILDVPIGTVMSRLARARVSLSEKLQNWRQQDNGGTSYAKS